MRKLSCSARVWRRGSATCLFACALALVGAPAKGANERTTVILHAQSDPMDCINLPFDCSDTAPVVEVAPGSQMFVSVSLRNYDTVSGFACRFAVDGGSGPDTWRDWTLLGASFACIPGQLAHVPVQSAPPPIEPGELTTVFSCVAGGAIQPLGWMLFQVGSSGCLSIEERQLGTGVLDCDEHFTLVPAVNRGVICVGSGGHDACESGQVAVEGTTWGAIKAQYR
jgi:hypothetical protein